MHWHRNLRHGDLQTTFDSRILQIACFLLFALLARMSTFGDLNYFQDELFFFYAGQRMHDGLLLYVDIWDRKPIGLFAIFAAIRLLPGDGIIAYQIVALLFAAATAWLVQAIATQGGRYEGAHEVAAFAAAAALHARSRPEIAVRLQNSIGLLEETRGKPAEARPRYAAALAIAEAELGPEHQDTLDTLTLLGNLARTEGRFGAHFAADGAPTPEILATFP